CYAEFCNDLFLRTSLVGLYYSMILVDVGCLMVLHSCRISVFRLVLFPGAVVEMPQLRSSIVPTAISDTACSLPFWEIRSLAGKPQQYGIFLFLSSTVILRNAILLRSAAKIWLCQYCS
ncbi:Hypothetical predicted protein, partial [Pelobates cultripes]